MKDLNINGIVYIRYNYNPETKHFKLCIVKKLNNEISDEDNFSICLAIICSIENLTDMESAVLLDKEGEVIVEIN